MTKGTLTAEKLTELYLARIGRHNPALNGARWTPPPKYKE